MLVSGLPSERNLMDLNTYLNVISIVSVAVVGFYAVRSKVKNENLKDLQDRVDILEKERELSRLQHLENQKAIAHLEGQLATYKEIPLKSIANSLEKLTESNTAILETLKGSAVVAREAQAEGGLLVKTKESNPLDVKPVEDK